MIGIIDYGMGNLRSVEKAFHYIGVKAKIITERKEIQEADKIVLPGVGAFCDAIRVIERKEFDKEIKAAVLEGKYFMGICLGMQLLFDISHENGEYNGMGILSGSVNKLDETLCDKIPHMGWNSLDIKAREPLFDGLPKKPYVYFVHSYYLETKAPIVSATCFYGKEIQVAVQKDNVFGLQFHPEKSGDTGLKILKNFGGLK